MWETLLRLLFEYREEIITLILSLLGWRGVSALSGGSVPGPVQTFRKVTGQSGTASVSDPVLIQIGEKAKACIDRGDIAGARAELNSWQVYREKIVEQPQPNQNTQTSKDQPHEH